MCRSLLDSGWANVRSLPKYYGEGSGPMQGFCIRNFRPLWANSRSLATSVRQFDYISWQHSRCRPAQEPCMAACWILDGPMQGHCPNIMAQNVGPCENFALGISGCCKLTQVHWRHLRIYSMGRFDYIFRQHSHCRPTQESCAGAHFILDRPTQGHCLKIIVQYMGPYEDFVSGISGCYGPI